jgi:PAT family beta-lactamase induction signal transducer AmpG
MRLPNLLATPKGRLAAFFCLYVTEGIPLGFAATAVATQLRRQDVGPAAIGAFVASFYLPWAFKWAFGPIVDVFASERLGRRRGWILGAQVLMAATLLSTVLLHLPGELWLFTIVLLVHNTFGAIQDVAIDALACETLREHERGTANGLMFAGASIGQLIGGAGVLFLMGFTGFQPTFFFVAGAILTVTALVVLPMREEPGPPRVAVAGSRLRAAGTEVRNFSIDAFRSFVGTRGAFSGLVMSLLPPGAMCLGLALQSNLAVELGLSDDEVAALNAWALVVSAVMMVAGGWLSDRFGRRRMLFVYTAAMGLPVLYLAGVLAEHGWIMPVSTTLPNRPAVPAALVTALWVAILVYHVFNGLMYGTRTAICMDVTNPRVAATQFTAYMALQNVVISYSAVWQGAAIEAWGYPRTMVVDALFGVVCLAVIPFMARKPGEGFADDLAPVRTRAIAAFLGAACLVFLPYQALDVVPSAARAIAGTVFTVVFIGSAVFLIAGRAVLGASSRALTRVGMWLAPLLLAMYARYHVDALAEALSSVADPAAVRRALELALLAVPAAAGVVLLALALCPWRELYAGAPAAESGES